MKTNLYREIVGVCENRTKHMNTLRVQNVEHVVHIVTTLLPTFNPALGKV
jgi:hypothetical protein